MDGKVFILFFCCCFFVATKAIDFDYYMGSLRATNCNNKHGLLNCKRSCKGAPALCHKEECYCHQSIVDIIESSNTPVLSSTSKQEVHVKILPHIIPNESDEDERELKLISETLRPTLRHHIAHFCSSLDKARKCIRKCAKTGKPAFCGKDHICYCGHKYGSHDSENENDVLKTYKEFADMYAKYLGVSGRVQVSNENEHDVNSDEEENGHRNKKQRKAPKS